MKDKILLLSEKDGHMPVVDWISEYAGVPRPEEEMDNIVADFTMMWAFFEVCFGDINCLEIANKIDNLNEPIVTNEGFENLFASLKERYFLENSQHDFNALGWRGRYEVETAKPYAEQTFVGNAANEEKLKVMLFVTYRVRNNLFHGRKRLEQLHSSRQLIQDSTEILKYGCQYLNLQLPEAV